MTQEDLLKTLTELDDKSIEEARDYKVRKKPLWKDWRAYGALAAVIILAVLIVPRFGRTGVQTSLPGAAVKKVLAAGPEKVGKGEDYRGWLDEQGTKARQALPLSQGTASYSADIMKEVLTAKDENTACSPLNTYLAFAMLAETCEGNTRQQILDMLGAEDLETVRKTANAIWEANAADTPILQSLLANSLWLNDEISFNESTLQTLAEQYHASSFRGTAGSDKMNKALQDWTNDATGGLLKDYVKDLKTTPDTVMALLSTLYFKGEWDAPFREEATKPAVFHGAKGDTQVQMMHKTVSAYAVNDAWSAVRLPIQGERNMIFCLPAEGTDVNALLSDPSVLQLTGWEKSPWEYSSVDLSLPKFKVSAKTDLLPVLEALGVTDALDSSKADFSPLTQDKMTLFVGKAEHAATVEIDEAGVTGAAYTEIEIMKQSAVYSGPIELTFDRPFLFMVTGADGSILFAGIVRNITE